MADEVNHVETKTELRVTFERAFGGWVTTVTLAQGENGFDRVSLAVSTDNDHKGNPLRPRIDDVPVVVLRKLLAMVDELPPPPHGRAAAARRGR